MPSRERGRGDRLKETASSELIDTAYTLEADDTEILFEGMSAADIAHVLMLLEEGIIPEASGKRLLSALLDLDSIPPERFDATPSRGDTYTNREHHLKQVLGNEAGWVHVGRARRECSTIGFILAVRRRLLHFGQSLAGASRALLKQASENLQTVIPDFTYLQHAQPTTLAHYLLTFEYPLLRDLERLPQSFGRLNRSPAGCGSVNGSRLPLNRSSLSSRLGFEGQLSVHARDAMWRPDIPIEIAALLVSVCINLNRFAEELQIWTTAEFGMVDLDDRHCRTSVIMPQKKNPYALTYFRGLTGNVIGKATGILSVQKTSSGQPDSRMFVYGELPRAMDLSRKGVDLLSAVIRSMAVRPEVMSEQASKGFVSSTDLAEMLMLSSGLDYATAHRIVGAAVRTAIDKGRETLTADLVRRAASDLDFSLALSDDDLSGVLNPESIIASRDGIGGASGRRLKEMIDECREATSDAEEWLTRQAASGQSALVALKQAARDYIGR